MPSPKVATYDLEPAMSAPGVTDEVVRRIAAGPPDLVVAQLRERGHGRPHRQARADDRGGRDRSTAAWRGSRPRCAASAASSPSRPITATPSRCGTTPAASPTPRTRPTRCRSSSSATRPAGVRLEEGILADVAPTLLDLMGLAAPRAMTGRSLLRALNPPRGASRRRGSGNIPRPASCFHPAGAPDPSWPMRGHDARCAAPCRMQRRRARGSS